MSASRQPRNAFEGLLMQAHALGVRDLAFAVDMHAYLREDPKAWNCHGADRNAFGRTGEEALRNLVERLT